MSFSGGDRRSRRANERVVGSHGQDLPSGGFYRVRGQALAILAVSGVGVVALARAAYAFIDAGGGAGATLGVLCLLMASVFAFVAMRRARAGVRVREGGVEIRNTFRTVAIPWGEIDRFSLKENDGFVRAAAVLNDGSAVPITGIEGARTRRRRRRFPPETLVDRLNAELAKARDNQ